jgi:hypothetical protein
MITHTIDERVNLPVVVMPMNAVILLLIGVLSICGIRCCNSFVYSNSKKVSEFGIPTAALTAMHQMDGDDVTISTIATTEILHQILQVAIDASKKAGDIILGNAGGVEVTERKANSRDLLTLIDPLCEKVGLLLLLQACSISLHYL